MTSLKALPKKRKAPAVSHQSLPTSEFVRGLLLKTNASLMSTQGRMATKTPLTQQPPRRMEPQEQERQRRKLMTTIDEIVARAAAEQTRLPETTAALPSATDTVAVDASTITTTTTATSAPASGDRRRSKLPPGKLFVNDNELEPDFEENTDLPDGAGAEYRLSIYYQNPFNSMVVSEYMCTVPSETPPVNSERLLKAREQTWLSPRQEEEDALEAPGSGQLACAASTQCCGLLINVAEPFILREYYPQAERESEPEEVAKDAVGTHLCVLCRRKQAQELWVARSVENTTLRITAPSSSSSSSVATALPADAAAAADDEDASDASSSGASGTEDEASSDSSGASGDDGESEMDVSGEDSNGAANDAGADADDDDDDRYEQTAAPVVLASIRNATGPGEYPLEFCLCEPSMGIYDPVVAFCLHDYESYRDPVTKRLRLRQLIPYPRGKTYGDWPMIEPELPPPLPHETNDAGERDAVRPLTLIPQPGIGGPPSPVTSNNNNNNNSNEQLFQ